MEDGARLTKRMQDPLLPEAVDILEHETTHLPHRSWCRHCVRGRGKQLAHHRAGDVPDAPQLHVDFCFMGEESEACKVIEILCAKESSTNIMMSSTVPSKSTGTFIAMRAMTFPMKI